jgi:hypothetical protein
MSREEMEKRDRELVAEALTKLGEHFDSVQIFVTRHESGEHNGTVKLDKGVGNWFARFGQVKEWEIREEEQTRINARRLNENP